MERITIGTLKLKVDYLNRITGSPETSYTRKNGQFKANPGNYHISGAYGGWSLERMHNEGGGVESIISGFRPKRELFELICAYVKGIEAQLSEAERKGLA